MSDAVSERMRETVRACLRDIEETEGARILLAVESGSRAWGFHSSDSDYDVRFIYARPKSWHYMLGEKRDVIERPIDEELDISGWELGKALSLSLGSNAVVAEWVQSPIVYQARPDALEALTAFAGRAQPEIRDMALPVAADAAGEPSARSERGIPCETLVLHASARVGAALDTPARAGDAADGFADAAARGGPRPGLVSGARWSAGVEAGGA